MPLLLPSRHFALQISLGYRQREGNKTSPGQIAGQSLQAGARLSESPELDSSTSRSPEEEKKKNCSRQSDSRRNPLPTAEPAG